jgi:hypothetical protein
MTDGQDAPNPADPNTVSRRDSVRLTAAFALGAGLGVPSQLLGGSLTAARMQLKFYKAANDGGQLVGSVELTDGLTSFITSAAGARAQLKWYDGTGQELVSMAMPKMCCIKLQP